MSHTWLNPIYKCGAALSRHSRKSHVVMILVIGLIAVPTDGRATTIVIRRTPSTIVVGADSKAVNYQLNIIGEPVAVGATLKCKIRQADNSTFYAIAGQYDFDVDAMAVESFKKGKTLLEKVTIFERAVRPSLITLLEKFVTGIRPSTIKPFSVHLCCRSLYSDLRMESRLMLQWTCLQERHLFKNPNCLRERPNSSQRLLVARSNILLQRSLCILSGIEKQSTESSGERRLSGRLSGTFSVLDFWFSSKVSLRAPTLASLLIFCALQRRVLAGTSTRTKAKDARRRYRNANLKSPPLRNRQVGKDVRVKKRVYIATP